MCIGTENKEKNRDRDKDRDRHRCTRAKSLQSCLTLCDPMDRSLPGSSVHGILQERILEWTARYNHTHFRGLCKQIWIVYFIINT